MALPLITISVWDTNNESQALKQMSSYIVASAFNDYLIWTMHGYYVDQVRRIRQALYESSISDGEIAEERMMRVLELSDGCFFRRVRRVRMRLMKNPYDKAVIDESINRLDVIIKQETRRNQTEIRTGLERVNRFFHGPLFSLYSGNAVDLAKALDVCHAEIEKEKERIR